MKASLKPKESTTTGEIRQNIIDNTWVVMASGRAKRPDEFKEKKINTITNLPKYKDNCVFCNLGKYPQEPDTLRLPNDPDKWQVHIFPNKYPAFRPKKEFKAWQKGPYRTIEAIGYHEVVAPKHHNQFEHAMTEQELALELEAITLRYRELKTQPSVNYIQVIKNHGASAGASIEHPHHQIFTTPTLPNDVALGLNNAELYYKQYGTDPFTAMVAYEQESQERIVYENEYMLAFCPYASKSPFEIWLMPKEPEPYFEHTTPEKRLHIAKAMKEVLRRLYKGLNNPPYNYYIHSAPCDDTGFVCNLATFKHYRWHIEIQPRLSILAGFELGTGMEINTALPEESAEFLRNIIL